MEIQNFLNNTFTVTKLHANTYQISAPIQFPNGDPIYLFLQKTNKEFILTDKKSTLKFMSQIYALSSSEIKYCIAGVLKANKIKMTNGILVDTFTEPKQISKAVLNMLMCISQMIKMYVFFEPPENS